MEANDPKIKALLEAWHENEQQCGTLKDSEHRDEILGEKKAIQRTKYILLNNGGSGHFIVDGLTNEVFSIKAYGQINRKKPRGQVEFLTKFIKLCTKRGVDYTHTFWYTLHPTNNDNPPEELGWVECGCCDHWHPKNYSGDCRNDIYRWPLHGCD